MAGQPAAAGARRGRGTPWRWLESCARATRTRPAWRAGHGRPAGRQGLRCARAAIGTALRTAHCGMPSLQCVAGPGAPSRSGAQAARGPRCYRRWTLAASSERWRPLAPPCSSWPTPSAPCGLPPRPRAARSASSARASRHASGLAAPPQLGESRAAATWWCTAPPRPAPPSAPTSGSRPAPSTAAGACSAPP